MLKLLSVSWMFIFCRLCSILLVCCGLCNSSDFVIFSVKMVGGSFCLVSSLLMCVGVCRLSRFWIVRLMVMCRFSFEVC